jgi:UDP-glucose 6-dehydrogenase
MHVSVVGSGYIETTIAAWFAELGYGAVKKFITGNQVRSQSIQLAAQSVTER